MQNSSNNKGGIKLKALKKKLKWGDYTKIALKLNKEPQTISAQFNRNKNLPEETIKAALDLLKEKKEHRDELNKQIKSI